MASLLAWVVGTQVSYVWDERRRRRESDLAALAAFYRLYGEFFATWKLWNAHKRFEATLAPPDQVQWSLLERAEAAEGGFEALLVKLASERELSERDQRMLGSFREAYQMLRESIRVNEPLDRWASPRGGDGFEQYRAFKGLAEYVAFLLEASPKRRSVRDAAINALRRRHLTPPPKPQSNSDEAIKTLAAITKRADFHGRWWKIATDQLPLGSDARSPT